MKEKAKMKKDDPKIDEAAKIIEGKMQEFLITPRAPMERERYFNSLLGGVSSDYKLDPVELGKKFGKKLKK